MRFFIFIICVIAMTGNSAAQEIIGFPREDFGKVVLSGKQSFSGKLEGPYGSYNNEPISNYNKRSIFARLGRAVGRLDILTNIRVFPCTGFLISPRYLITNYHCVPGILEIDAVRERGATRIDGVQIVLGYVREGIEEDASRFTVSPTPVEYSKQLDYAILEVFGRPSDKFGMVKIASTEPYANQPFFIIGHPLGSAQKISREKCMSASPVISGGQVRHKCDTLPGNSGSPVFDQDTRSVIALHHAGSSRNSINYAIPFSRIVKQSPILQKLAAGVFAEPDPEPVCTDIEFNIQGQKRCLKPKETFRDCTDGWCPEMVVIPRGRFLMGSNKGNADEKPPHKVTISKPFALGKYEVTVGQFKAFVQATGHDTGSKCWTFEKDKKGKSAWKERSGRSYKKPGFSQEDDHPVTCVSWDDAVAYAKWLSGKTGKKYRLPTEAEWEYATRAKSRTKYHFGNREKELCGYANGADETKGPDGITWSKGKAPCKDGYWYTASVGSFKPNGFGLHDMHGNVWEWVRDWKGKYKSGDQTDPKGPRKGSDRVARGGSWDGSAGGLRSASRGNDSPGYRGGNLGFRLLRQPS